MDERRRLPWDWIDLPIPEGVRIGEDTYIESAYSFARYRSQRKPGVLLGKGSSAYLGCMFDLGQHAEVRIDAFTLLHGVWFLCDELITVGHHTMISWDVVIMDTPQWSRDRSTRRKQTEDIAGTDTRSPLSTNGTVKPVAIGNNVWIGFGSIITPGITIGDGAVIGCRSVVIDDVLPYTVAAGNPAKQIRNLGEGY